MSAECRRRWFGSFNVMEKLVFCHVFWKLFFENLFSNLNEKCQRNVEGDDSVLLTWWKNLFSTTLFENFFFLKTCFQTWTRNVSGMSKEMIRFFECDEKTCFLPRFLKTFFWKLVFKLEREMSAECRRRWFGAFNVLEILFSTTFFENLFLKICFQTWTRNAKRVTLRVNANKSDAVAFRTKV